MGVLRRSELKIESRSSEIFEISQVNLFSIRKGTQGAFTFILRIEEFDFHWTFSEIPLTRDFQRSLDYLKTLLF